MSAGPLTESDRCPRCSKKQLKIQSRLIWCQGCGWEPADAPQTVPLPVEEPEESLASIRARERAEAVAKATAKGAMPDDVAAELGISRRSVYRLANVANNLATPTTGKEAPMATIDEIGTATLQALRTTMTRVRDAEQVVARAQQQLESAREASADEARRLTNALNALGVEIPTDLSLSVRAVIYPQRGRGAARQMAAVPAQTCPDCNQPVKGVGGLAIHRARSHKAS